MAPGQHPTGDQSRGGDQERLPAGRALVLIPTYNEAANVRRVVARVLAELPADVLIIDDNSPDGTGVIADEVAGITSRVMVLHRPNKSGLGRAYLAGIRWGLARNYDFILQMDCDSSHDPVAAASLLAGLADAHVAVGSRYVAGGGSIDWPLHRRVLSRVASFYSRMLLRIPQRDTTSGFKAWRSDLLRRIDLDSVRSRGYGFQIEMAFLAGGAGGVISELPIVFADREEGRSKLTLGIVTEAALLVLRLGVSRSRWQRAAPLPLPLPVAIPLRSAARPPSRKAA